MVLKVFHKGFSYSKDGKGNRLVLHLQGCNMRCPWCTNPEGISLSGSLMFKPQLIEGLCPHGNIKNDDVNIEVCASCEKRECVTKNKNTRITLSCRDYDVNEILEECIASKVLFVGGGGVTVTGGEPTMQFKPLLFLFKSLKKEGISTCIETNATHKRLPELLPYVDQLIFDFKSPLSEAHKIWTGVGITAIKTNIKWISENHSNVLIRTPLINGVNADKESLLAFIEFYKTINTANISFEFLAYHNYGLEKWKSLKREYEMKDAFIKEGTLEHFESEMRRVGFNVIRT